MPPQASHAGFMPGSRFGGRRLSELASTIDIMPTILAVLDLAPGSETFSSLDSDIVIDSDSSVSLDVVQTSLANVIAVNTIDTASDSASTGAAVNYGALACNLPSP